MAKIQDSFYFNNFVGCAEHACKAAGILDETLRNFKSEALEARLQVIHEEEHGADCKKHEMLEVLVKAFITPIEREDILDLSHNIDELVDKIEDVLIRIYCNNIQTIRPDALEMSAMLVKACTEVKELLKEFQDFKRSKKIREHIILINTLESDADTLFINCIRKLHTECKDPLEVFAWHELYVYLEQCMDACEHIADAVEAVIMKNS